MTTTTKDTGLRLRRLDARYYVDIDVVTVGWVLKNEDGWAFYSTIRDALQGVRLTWGNATRRDALIEGISSLRIYHLGSVVRLNMESMKDEFVYIDCDRLKELTDRLMDEKYGMSS